MVCHREKQLCMSAACCCMQLLHAHAVPCDRFPASACCFPSACSAPNPTRPTLPRAAQRAHVDAQRILLELQHLPHREPQALGVMLRVWDVVVELLHQGRELLAKVVRLCWVVLGSSSMRAAFPVSMHRFQAAPAAAAAAATASTKPLRLPSQTTPVVPDTP